jgi:hypothetical protein
MKERVVEGRERLKLGHVRQKPTPRMRSKLDAEGLISPKRLIIEPIQA